MAMDTGRLWYTEDDPTHGTQYHSIRSILHNGRTGYQDVLILDTEEWGKTLILDGDIQSTESDESVFHEALVHPAMIAHPDPRSVLILGSAEGAALREVLAYGSVERAVMADIDEELVEICAKHLPEWSEGCFDESIVELVFDDAKPYLERRDKSFDIVIADIVDYAEDGSAHGPAAQDLYRLLHERLSSDGILAIHGLELDPLEYEDFVMARNALKKLFPVVVTYCAYIPSFGGESAFLLASKGPDASELSKDVIAKRLAERGTDEDKDIGRTLYFYDADAHVRMFNLPKNVKAVLSGTAPEWEAAE